MLPKVILVDIVDPHTTPEDSHSRLTELENLVNTYGGFVIIRKVQKRQMPDYRMYIGKGKVEEILNDAISMGATYIIVNNLLKPQQVYNLEELFEKHKIQVWDRIDLILKIFAKHAVTKEAKLQIEIASLRHLGPRTMKMGLELTRQGGGGSGGAGARRGQGETNIEVMRRHIQRREDKIRAELKELATRRGSERSHRRDIGFKTAAIVGYTNAGKSQLLISLTKKDVKVKNELFATLDSRIGKVWLPQASKEVLVSDTIGFIRDLPHELIDAFHSTLEEAIDSDVLLHVIDISDPEMELKIKVVNEVLAKLGCGDKPMIYVFNKIDLLKKPPTKAFAKKYAKHSPVFISAREKSNLEELKTKLAETFFPNAKALEKDPELV
jgi:GTP-binding protein HflX